MGKRRLLLGTWLTAMATALWWLISGLDDRLNSDLTVFMPTGATVEERLLLDELQQGAMGRLVLIAIEGSDASERARISHHLVNQLLSTGQFTQINNGGQQFNTGELQHLFEYRYLLSTNISAESFSVSLLRAALIERLHELTSPLSAFYTKLLPADPTNELLTLEQTLQPSQQPAKTVGVWSSDEDNRALLLAETRASGIDLDAQQQAVESIRNAFALADPSGKFRLLLSGPGVYGVMSREMIRSESTQLSLAASGLVAVILFIAYRSLPLILLGALPVISAMLAGTTAVTLWFGSIHGITLAFGITLLGMTIDYPIHLFSHTGRGEESNAGIKRIWPTLRLSALTSGAAFAVVMTTSFDGLAQLGLFTIAGVAAAALFTRWLMPDLPGMHGIRHRPGISGWGESLGLCRQLDRSIAVAANSGLKYPTRLPILSVVGIALSLSILWLWIQQEQLWENNLAALSPVPQQLIAQDRGLRQQLNAPEVSHLLIVTANSAEKALQQAEALQPRLKFLQSQNIIRDSDLLTKLLPSSRTQLKRQMQLPDMHSLRHNLSQAMEGTPFRPGTFEPFLESVEKSRSLPPLSPDQTTGTLIGNKVGALLRQWDAGWILMIPLSGVTDPQALNREFNDHSLDNVRYINLKSETGQLVIKFRNEALYRLSWGLLFLIGLLLFVLKSPGRVARVLLPVCIALVVDIALLLALGQRLSLFHLVSLLLVAGISLDYSLFINRPDADWQERCRTLHSLTVCLLSTATVFGLLALSDIPVLKAIGSTVVIGVTCGYVLSFALAPTGIKPT